MSAESLRARLRKMQSVGATILSNATYALAEVDALEAGTPVDVDPEPTPEPEPEPTPGGLGASGALTPISGGDVSTKGQTIENARIDGNLTLTGSGGATLRNVHVTGILTVRGGTFDAEHVTCGAWITSSARSTLRNGLITGGVGKDGLHVTSDSGSMASAIFEDVDVHSGPVNDPQHYDGIQVRGVRGLVLRRVRLLGEGTFNSAYNAAVFLQGANGGNDDVLIEDCELHADGWYTLYLNATNLRVTGSVIGAARGDYLYPGGTIPDVFEDNRTPDGEPLTTAGGKIVRA